MLSMFPQEMREEIANHPAMPPQLAPLWKASPSRLETEDDLRSNQLARNGATPKATVAYLELFPILQANTVIQDYLRSQNNPSLQRAIPDLPDPDSLVQVAIAEYSLEPADVSSLRQMLRAPKES